MSKVSINRLLEEVYKVADDRWARSGVDRSKQEVTVTRTNLRNAFKEAFNKEHQKEFPGSHNPFEGDSAVFNKAATAALNALELHLLKPSSTSAFARPRTRDKIVFSQPRAVKTPFNVIKQAGVKVLQEELRKHNKKPLSPQQQLEIRKGLERLHTNTTVGTARLAYVFKYLEDNPETSAFLGTKHYTSLKDKYGDVTTEYTVIDQGTKRHIRSVQTVSLHLAPKSHNFAGSEHKDWKNIKPKLEKALTKWAENREFAHIEGSKTPAEEANDKVENLAMSTLKDVPPNIKVRPKTKANRKKKRRPKQSKVFKGKVSNTAPKTTEPEDLKNKTKESSINLRSLFLLLNAQINDKVKENMMEPALVNRTGRFAQSVRIVDVTMTPKGFPSIGYTYQRAPYSTFELGGAQGSSDRDPRKLIDKSIRQLATQAISGRFFTRRV